MRQGRYGRGGDRAGRGPALNNQTWRVAHVHVRFAAARRARGTIRSDRVGSLGQNTPTCGKHPFCVCIAVRVYELLRDPRARVAPSTSPCGTLVPSDCSSAPSSQTRVGRIRLPRTHKSHSGPCHSKRARMGSSRDLANTAGEAPRQYRDAHCTATEGSERMHQRSWVAALRAARHT